MKILETAIPGILVIQPRVFGDARGWFLETFSSPRYEEAGIGGPFVQDNMSRSTRGTVRGLHLQHPHSQGKLLWVVEGAVLDVAVDVRVGSPRFGTSVVRELSADNHEQLWLPPGLAHGFCVLSDAAVFVYKCTEIYRPEYELGVAWNDPDLAIPWPRIDLLVSPKDQVLPRLRDISPERLPAWTGA